MPDDKRFAELVSLACHDLRTPLATVYGFARTLARTDLEAPMDRYVEMIEAASQQLGELLDQLSLVARIRSGRFEPRLEEVDSLELVQGAARELDEGRVVVSGAGGPVKIPPDEMRRALSQLARAASRHGGLDSVDVRVDGPTLAISPVTVSSGPVLVGDQLRDFGAAAAGALIRALGGSVQVEGEALVVRLPA
jgi:signal transduction histidine kinase